LPQFTRQRQASKAHHLCAELFLYHSEGYFCINVTITDSHRSGSRAKESKPQSRIKGSSVFQINFLDEKKHLKAFSEGILFNTRKEMV
jgi:hypothetical protein